MPDNFNNNLNAKAENFEEFQFFSDKYENETYLSSEFTFETL